MPLAGLGQSTGSNEGLVALAAALDRLERAGVEVAELMPDRYWVLTGGIINRTRLRLLMEVLVDRPLRYTVHAPFALNFFDQCHPGLQDQLFQSCLEVTQALGAEVLVYHSGRREAGGSDAIDLDLLLEQEREGLRRAGDLAESLELRIAVENMTPTSERKAGVPNSVPYGADLRALARQIAAVEHPSVGICLDLGHAHLYETPRGGDLVAAIQAAAPFVNHLHIHDNFGRPNGHPHYPTHPDLRAIGEDDMHMPVGWGTIPYDEIFSRVRFPQAPIALSEAAVVDDDVLVGTVRSLEHLVALNRRAEAAEPALP